MRAVLLVAVVLLVGCSSAVKPDPWAEYQVALDVVAHEEKLQQQVFDMHAKDPSEKNKELLDKVNARFDKATKHAKAVRERLPN